MRAINIIERQSAEDYLVTYRLQQDIVESKLTYRNNLDTLIFVEHNHIYTVGRGIEFQSTDNGVPWIETNRGGQATYHGHGQLVCYLLFDLEHHGKDIHKFLRRIEHVVINCLNSFGLSTCQREGFTGVWIKDGGTANSNTYKKIASIGIGVRRWISFHGVSINIDPNLDYFAAISACGENGTNVTSLAKCLGECLDSTTSHTLDLFSEVKKRFLNHLFEEFSFTTNRPTWLRTKGLNPIEFDTTSAIIKKHKLHTVCQEARCPNISECWSQRTATFLILGDTCTRACSFCAVKHASNIAPPDPTEPQRIAQAIQDLSIRHAVITSVTRDDLPDKGAGQFAAVAKAITDLPSTQCAIEFLVPDFGGNADLVMKALAENRVHIFNHNIETVPRLFKIVRTQANFLRSLNVLKIAHSSSPSLITKSGIMVGLGETKQEVLEVMDRLREVDCNVLTIGQYLQPTKQQLPIIRYITPEEFEDYKAEAQIRGFQHIESSPLTRSSYHARANTARA